MQAVNRFCFYRWLCVFLIVHIGLGSAVILFYWPDACALLPTLFSKIYFSFAFVAQVSVWGTICVMISAIFGSVVRWRRFRLLCTALCGTLFFGALVGDALSYRLYHMHYALVGWDIYQAGAFSAVLAFDWLEWMVLGGGLLLVFVLELILVSILWNYCERYRDKHRVWLHHFLRVLLFLLAASVLCVYACFAWALWEGNSLKSYRSGILCAGRIAPYLSELMLHIFSSHKLEGTLHYPIRPIRYTMKSEGEKLNLLIIGVDAWRYGTLTPNISPYMYQFAKKAIQFKKHDSGGNCTQSGLFSLFYGIPPTYWSAFLKKQQSPVLLDTLKKEKYRIGIFMSAPIYFPAFNKTIFANVDDLSTTTPGGSSLERDQHTTQHVIQFLEQQVQQQRSGRPFFAFVFYDTLHNYCESARPPESHFFPTVKRCNRLFLTAKTDPQPYLNLYDNKVRYVDAQVHEVLVALEKQHLLEHTVVMITADHGEQINDQQEGLWGHASAYNAYQLHVPMIVFWPGRPPAVVEYQTTHYDVVPTLMQNLLSVRNALSDYTVGHSLFSAMRRPYSIAASYGDYAIIDFHLNKVMRVYPSGEYQPQAAQSINPRILESADRQLQKFLNQS